MNKLLTGITVGCLAMVSLLWLAFRSQRVLEQGLPQRIECANQADAIKQAGPNAYPVRGTGSMAPFFPATPAGVDPMTTFVAYVVPSGASYGEIKPGNLCIYWMALPDGTKLLVIHQAALKDSGGWIMSGLHNKRSESWARVTKENFVVVIGRAYVWKQ